MPERLTVIADQVYLRLGDAGFPADGLARLAIQLAQQKVDAAEIRRAGAFTAGQTENFGPNLRCKGHEGKSQLFHLRGQAITGDAAEGRIHTIRAGAGHEAQHDAGLLLKKPKNRMFHRSSSFEKDNFAFSVARRNGLVKLRNSSKRPTKAGKQRMFIGIDGGGTSTKVEIHRGGQSERRKYGPFNISAIGEEAFRKLLREMFADWGGLEECRAICVGGAGVSCGELEQILREELKPTGFDGKLLLRSDSEIALRGAVDGPGCILIAGTGSIGFGMNEAGETARVGGFGHLIDDEGSGYALGRDALSAAVRTLDGRMDAALLRDGVLRFIGGRDTGDILNYVYYQNRGKAAVAALSRVTVECAVQGDETALAILRRGAQELRGIVEALARRLRMEKPRLALLGGLLDHEGIYRALAEEALRPVAQVVQSAHDALWGAAKLAEEAAEERS